jgi:bifunctional UDP-N-acetylglucosamine pyrophosphorylase/glucosamine-1-phosphate N-acetyltransferase
MIMPGRRIGVYSCVGPGVVLNEDVPDRQALMVRQALDRLARGPERYGR